VWCDFKVVVCVVGLGLGVLYISLYFFIFRYDRFRWCVLGRKREGVVFMAMRVRGRLESEWGVDKYPLRVNEVVVATDTGRIKTGNGREVPCSGDYC
jgi:hypothetical protein